MDFIILGGGCFGSFYTRQLLRAQKFLSFQTIHIVDIKKDCQAFLEHGDGAGKIVYNIQDWKDFFLPYFREKINDVRLGKPIEDHYVPPTFAPHVLMEVFLDIFQKDFPLVKIGPEPMIDLLKTPVDMALPNGTRALSFATWMCPASCIEPPTCPHTGGPKDWDMKDYLQNIKTPLYVFQCRHLAMGVGTIPVQEIVNEYLRFEKQVSQSGTHSVSMASVSSCHGLIGQVKIENV
ncbi:MAG: hypothetical protein IPJ69_04930 [Deltaproteobacteria bacterium]|nr:MAG: hypothetical protein IPJ69_04930 [Deltaproteobacteria bacterium]